MSEAPRPAAQAGPAAAAAPVRLDRKKAIILGVVEVAVLVLIATRVLPQVGSYSQAADALRGMSVLALAAVAVAVVAYLLWYGLPFMAAAPGLGFRRAQQINQASFAIGNGVPGGGAVVLGVQYAMFASWSYPAARAAAAIAAVGVWSVFVTLGLPVLGVLALVLSGDDAGRYTLAAGIGLLVLVAMVGLFAVVMRSEAAARRLGAWGDAAARTLPARLRRGREVEVTPALLHFREGIVDLVRERWAAITGAQLGVFLLQFAVLYVALRGLEGWGSEGTRLLAAFAAFAISQLGLMIPVTPGGLGTVDAAMVALLVALGTGSGGATAAALVWRASSFVPQIVVGVLALVLWTKAANRLAAGRARAAAAAPAPPASPAS